MEFEYLSALAFVRPDLGQQLISDLHIATERPVRVITTLPIFEKGSAQRTIDQMRPQLVLIDAEVDGYSLPDVRSLREEAKFPLGVVGLAQPGSSQMEAMLDVHLDAVFNLPLNPGTIERICTELPSQFQALAAQWGKGAWGAGVPETIRTATAAAGVSSWQRQVIGVWAPKGHVRLRLNVDAPYGILNAASAYHTSKGRPSLEADIPQRIEGLMTAVKGAPNLKVLAGVMNMEQSRHEHLAGEAGMEFARFLLPLLSRNYDFVIVDPGSSMNVGFHQGVLHEVDYILVVCEPDMTSIADVKEGVHKTVIPRIGIDKERFGLVINKWQDDLGVSLQEAANFAKVSAIGILPLDTTGNVTRAGNEGISYIAKYANERKNPAPTEATMNGIAELAAQFYPPIGAAWSERIKNGRVKRGFGILRGKRIKPHA